MSGSIGLGSLVLSLFDSGVDTSGAGGLLSALYAAPGSTGSYGSPAVALKSAEANSTKDIAQTAAQPAIARDLATFRSAIASAKTPEQLLQNPTVLKILLTANGLGDQAQYAALAQKALLSDTTKSTALANTLPNTAWKSTASLYDFANKGLAILRKPGVVDTLASGYAEVIWRQSLDQSTPGLSAALTFKAQASTIKSVDQILGDSTLRNVVTTALNIPKQIAFQDLTTQEKAISSRLDITQFKDPRFVAKFATQFLVAAQANATDSGGSTSSLDQLAASANGLVV